MKSRRFGVTLVEYVDGEDWYVIVTPPYAAVCNKHGKPHLHRHPLRSHPQHKPSVPTHPELTLRETLARLDGLCTSLGRGPEFDEIRKVLA